MMNWKREWKQGVMAYSKVPSKHLPGGGTMENYETLNHDNRSPVLDSHPGPFEYETAPVPSRFCYHRVDHH
jgi:hypothetical protein